jgi:hypothetical protein
LKKLKNDPKQNWKLIKKWKLIKIVFNIG